MLLFNLFNISEIILHPRFTFIALPFLIVIFLVLSHIFTKKYRHSIFLVDFACYKPPDSQKSSREFMLNLARQTGHSEETVNFMAKVMQKSGVGESSYLSEALLSVPFNVTIEAAREESEKAIFGAVDALLAKTKVRSSEIRILIVNCTVFNAIPSLSSVIVNRYRLREDISSFNLSGMGCSAGLRAIDLAKQLLQVNLYYPFTKKENQ